MSSSRANQTGATAGGSIAGRDITNVVLHQPRHSPLESILKRVDQARADDPELDRLIDELQHFAEYATTDTPVGLSRKLSDGSRDDLVMQAMREKEIFAKMLAEYQHSRSAQQLYAFLLGSVRDRFKRHIVPLLGARANPREIDAAIVESVINPCLEDLLHNPLAISPTCLHGMIYFLTGNCYLKWTGE